MRRRVALLGLPLLLLGLPPLVTACARGSGPGEPEPTATADGFPAHAVGVAAAWRTAPGREAWRTGFVPLQDLTVLPPDPGFTDATKQAFAARYFRLATGMPREAGGRRGTIRFADGSTLAVPLVGIAEAYSGLQPQDPPPCPERAGNPAPTTSGPENPVRQDAPDGCTVLTITGVSLGTVNLRTSRGAATTPAWLFAVRELKGPIARVAVAPAAVASPPVVPPPSYPAGLVGAEDLARVSGAAMTVRLRVGACDTDIKGLVYEADDVVVVGGTVTTKPGACTDNLLYKPVPVTLDKPLGDRPVLDAQTGTVLSLTVE
jgi:hypothetical protein